MSFKDIKGQDSVIALFKEYIRQGRLRGGYLFIGPDGVGKMHTAYTLAKSINCLKNNSDSCDACPSCLKIAKNEHPDVHIFNHPGQFIGHAGHHSKAESGNLEAIKIEEVRQLQRDINLRPYEGRVKVFVIDNAHNLTPEAQNALLKTLEEPPKDSLIILISSKPALLFKTITSRCKSARFYPLDRRALEEELRRSYSLDGGLAHFLAYFSEGRMGAALRLKEIDIMKEKNRIIDEFTGSGGLNPESFFAPDRDKLCGCLNILAAWFRDIYMAKMGIQHAELINLDRKEQVIKAMNHYTFLELDGILGSISNAFLYLEQNVNIKLLLSSLREDMKYGTYTRAA